MGQICSFFGKLLNHVPQRSQSQRSLSALEEPAPVIFRQPHFNSNNFGRAKEITAKLVLSHDQILGVVRNMEIQFARGLANEEEAIVKMLITYVRSTPTHKETGTFLALDLGGTNFRTLVISLPGRHWKHETHVISEQIMTGTGVNLFDFIAKCLVRFVHKYGEDHLKLDPTWQHPSRYSLGFTFSFPCHQQGLATARLLRWSKGFRCSDVEGKDIAQMLRNALLHNPLKIGDDIVPIDVVAVINDTTGTLMSCALDDKKCSVALIVGTGCNACYIERLDKIPKWEGRVTEPSQVIINTEWGAFGEQGSGLVSIITDGDCALDRESINPGKQIFEKLISGLYLGEVVRQNIKILVSYGVLFGGMLPESLSRHNGFSAKMVSLAEKDESNKALKTALLSKMHILATDEDVAIVRMVCERVSTRGAQLVAAGLIAIIQQQGRMETVIGYDGSVLKYHPQFKLIMQQTMRRILREKQSGQTIRLIESTDGSGRGAAVVAAVACHLFSHRDLCQTATHLNS